MKWQNHMLIGASLGVVISPAAVPTAILGSTAPDWIEYLLKFFNIRVPHRGPTHYVLVWILLIAFFALVWDYRSFGLGFAVGGFSHVLADSFTIMGVPFAPWSDAKFHLFGGKLRTGNVGEYVVTGLIVACCWSFFLYAPHPVNPNKNQFIPFFYNWMGHYQDGLIDGKEWKDNRLKFL